MRVRVRVRIRVRARVRVRVVVRASVRGGGDSAPQTFCPASTKRAISGVTRPARTAVSSASMPPS